MLNKHVFFLLKILVSLVVVFVLYSNANADAFVALIVNMDLSVVLIAMFIQLSHVFLAAYRWKFILERMFVKVDYVDILSFQWAGYFFNQAMPSSVGGDAFRIYYLQKNDSSSLRNSAISVLLDRIVGVIGLAILVIVTAPIMFLAVSDGVVRWGMIALISIVVLSIGLFFALGSVAEKFLRWKIVNFVHSISVYGRRMFSSNKVGVELIVVSLLIHVNLIVSIIVLSYSMGLNIEVLHIFIVVPIATLLMIIPISIAGWGIREGAMVVGLGYYAVPTESALALSVVYGIVMIVVSLPVTGQSSPFFPKT